MYFELGKSHGENVAELGWRTRQKEVKLVLLFLQR
jgi:hypothetical protein